MKPFYVYFLRCADDSYYCGQTDSMDSRLQQHQEGKIGYTSTRKPFELVWQGEFKTRLGAIEFEQQIKGWSRAKKEALIRGDWEGIKQLAKSNNPVRSESNNSVRTTTTPVRTATTPVRAELVEALQNPSTSSGRTAIKERGNDASQTLRQAQGERIYRYSHYKAKNHVKNNPSK